MPFYKYRFCDGTVCDVEVSDTEYALLKGFDEQERQNNLRQRRHNTPLTRYARKERVSDKERDSNFKGG